MKKFKEEMFLEVYNRPIKYRKLSNKEFSLFKDYVNMLFKEKIENDVFFKSLIDGLKNIKSFDLIENSIQFSEVLREINIVGENEVYLIWDYPTDIDRVLLKYLIKYWEDIWFSPSDEVVGLFFPKSKKVVLITHYNTVYF